jgi:hypothetical protein
VQAALFCQGLINHESRTRKSGLPPLAHAHELLEALATDERREIYLARLQHKQARLAAAEASRRRGVRLALGRAAKAEFMATHEGTPRLFDHAEIARRNATRPPTDQLELVGPSPGLLKHHCCFPNCARFLCDLRSERDRATARAQDDKHGGGAAARARRHGLFHHLRWFQWPDRCYAKGMHATALQILNRRPGIARADYLALCARAFELDVETRAGHAKLTERSGPHTNSLHARIGMHPAELQHLLELIYDAVRGRAER